MQIESMDLCPGAVHRSCPAKSCPEQAATQAFNSRQEVAHDELVQPLLLRVVVAGKVAGGVDGRVGLVVMPPYSACMQLCVFGRGAGHQGNNGRAHEMLSKDCMPADALPRAFWHAFTCQNVAWWKHSRAAWHLPAATWVTHPAAATATAPGSPAAAQSRPTAGSVPAPAPCSARAAPQQVGRVLQRLPSVARVLQLPLAGATTVCSSATPINHESTVLVPRNHTFLATTNNMHRSQHPCMAPSGGPPSPP